jgi:hypothetical protein
MTKIKVRIEVTAEVDVEAWAETYGIAKADVREDVKTYALNQLQGAAATDEDLWEVTGK